jgi:6-methylsalicylate decarboxylase
MQDDEERAGTVTRRQAVGGGLAGLAAAALGAAPAAARGRVRRRVAAPLPRGAYRIDLHTHHFPPEYRRLLEAKGIAPGGVPIPAWSPDAHRAFMRRYGIAASVVSISDPGVHFGDPAETVEVARMVNEAGAALVKADPTRFAALAALPLPDVDAALAELRHALDVLKLDGVALLSHVEGRYLGDPALAPLYAELDRRRAVVFVHPSPPVQRPPMIYPPFLFEYPFDTTRAAINLMYTGTLERYPHIRWQLAHGGGALPYLGWRASLAAAISDLLAKAVPDGPPAYYRRLIYDTALAATRAQLPGLLETAGAGQVVFGSDWPFTARLFDDPRALPAFLRADGPRGTDPQPSLALLGRRDRLRVERANALALFGRLASHHDRKTTKETP